MHLITRSFIGNESMQNRARRAVIATPCVAV